MLTHAVRARAVLAACAAVLTLAVRPANVESGALPRAIPFGVGERLEFALQYGPIQVGTATLSVSGIGRIGAVPCYHFVSDARSNPSYDSVYRVHDRVEAWADTSTLSTWRVEKHLREGDYQLDTVARFDLVQGTVSYDKGPPASVGRTVRDPLTAFFATRAMELRDGELITMPGHGDRKNYTIGVRVLRRETVTVPAGRFRCVVLQPSISGTGVFRQTGKMTVWVTDDAARIPVKLASKVTVGSVVGSLTRHVPGAAAPPPAVVEN